MTEETVNIDEVVEHTKGLIDDRGITKGEAAMRMAEQLDGAEAKDILKEL